MTALNPLAVQNAALLRELGREGPAETVSAIARRIGRDESNVRKSIKLLIAEGLATDPMCLTVEGGTQLEAIDRAEGRGEDKPGSSAGDTVAVVHAQLIPNPDNDRKDWDTAEAQADLEGLAADIKERGILQNPTVCLALPEFQVEGQPTVYRLNGGERRWRAVERLIAAGDWPEDRLITCRLLDFDALNMRLAALSENLQRRDLNPLEKARAFEDLATLFATQGVAEKEINREIATRAGKTIEHVQQHRSFLKLDDADQQRLALPKDDPRRLTVRDARQKVARKEEDTSEPLDLTPLQRLVAAELVHAVAARATYTYNDIAVAADARETPEGQALAEAGIANFGEALREYGVLGGHFTVRLHYNNPAFDLLPWALAGDAADRDAGLKAEYDAFGGYDGQGYSTEWLNPPQELTPEGQIIRDRLDAQALENEKAAAQRDADEAARKTRWAAARQRHIELFAEAATKPVWGVPEQTVEIAAAIDRPLPWAVTEGGKVFDANGKEVATFGYWQGCSDQGLVTARMIVAAVNAAGGLATPATAASPATPDDEEPEQDIDGNDPDAETDPDEFEADAEPAGGSAA